jgi:hypothetical protein
MGGTGQHDENHRRDAGRARRHDLKLQRLDPQYDAVQAELDTVSKKDDATLDMNLGVMSQTLLAGTFDIGETRV